MVAPPLPSPVNTSSCYLSSLCQLVLKVWSLDQNVSSMLYMQKYSNNASRFHTSQIHLNSLETF